MLSNIVFYGVKDSAKDNKDFFVNLRKTSDINVNILQ